MAKTTSKTTRTGAAKPNTPAPAQTGNTAEVPATVASQEATQAEPLQNPSTSASGEVESLPPVGEDFGDGPLPEIVVDSVTVTSAVEGFRRAGRAWSRTPTTVPASELSEDQLKVLSSEPMLTVVFGAAAE